MSHEVAFRQIPPWRNRTLRLVSVAFAVLLLVWCALSAAAYLAVERAPVLPGHVLSARTFYYKGSLDYRIDFVYTDEQGVEQQDRRDLVAGLAKEQGYTTPGAPISVKRFLGVALLEGAPNVFVGVPLVFAGLLGLMALIFFMVDRGEARRSRLALHGKLARGRVDATSVWSFRSSSTLT